MLQNAYLLAKIGADTAENERSFAENLTKICNYPAGSHLRASPPIGTPDAALFRRALRDRRLAPGELAALGGLDECRGPAGDLQAKLGKMTKFAKFCKFFGGLVLGCIKTKFCKKICV